MAATDQGAPSDRAPLTRDAVVDAAREITVVGGLDALNMRRVAAALGVTAPALYAHVRHKSDLISAMAERQFAALVARFEAIDEPDPVERTRAYARAYVDHALEEPELFAVLFHDQPDLGTSPRADLPVAAQAFALPAAATAEAIEAGRFRQTDPMLASLSLWAAVHGVATVLLLGLSTDRDPTELVEAVIDTVVRGLSP